MCEVEGVMGGTITERELQIIMETQREQESKGRPPCVRPSSVSMMAQAEEILLSACSNCGHTPMLPGRMVCIACEKKGVYGIKTETGYTLGNLPGGARPTAGGQLLRVEKWKSSENREEVHYFIEGTQTYVMGFNPALVPEDVVIRALKGLGYKV